MSDVTRLLLDGLVTVEYIEITDDHVRACVALLPSLQSVLSAIPAELYCAIMQAVAARGALRVASGDGRVEVASVDLEFRCAGDYTVQVEAVAVFASASRQMWCVTLSGADGRV
jgi:saccharopine dehydrogenase-like NADP-dependent oxidoreductase